MPGCQREFTKGRHNNLFREGAKREVNFSGREILIGTPSLFPTEADKLSFRFIRNGVKENFLRDIALLANDQTVRGAPGKGVLKRSFAKDFSPVDHLRAGRIRGYGHHLAGAFGQGRAPAAQSAPDKEKSKHKEVPKEPFNGEYPHPFNQYRVREKARQKEFFPFKTIPPGKAGPSLFDDFFRSGKATHRLPQSPGARPRPGPAADH